jgi:hypothetical protein
MIVGPEKILLPKSKFFDNLSYNPAEFQLLKALISTHYSMLYERISVAF